jgi:hypothetical protein
VSPGAGPPGVPAVVVVLGAVVALGAGAECGGGPPPTLTALRAEVLQPRCGATGCHGGTNPARGLDLVTAPHAALVDVATVVDPSRRYVVAGDPSASLLLQVLRGPVASADGASDCRQMPPGFVLEDADVDAVEAWIAAGARDDGR